MLIVFSNIINQTKMP